jgi:hypothetical protein
MSNIKHDEASLQSKRLRQRSHWRTRVDPPEAEPPKTLAKTKRAITDRIAFLERYVAARRPLSRSEEAELNLLRILANPTENQS